MYMPGATLVLKFCQGYPFSKFIEEVSYLLLDEIKSSNRPGSSTWQHETHYRVIP